MEAQYNDLRKRTSKQKEWKSQYLVTGSVQPYVVLELSIVAVMSSKITFSF